MLRKISFLILSISLLLLTLHVDAMAEERSVVTLESYDVINGVVAPGESVDLSLTFINKSKNTTAEDVMIYAYNASDQIFPVFGEANPLFIGSLSPGQTYKKEASIYISENLLNGNYFQLNFKLSYHDSISGDETNTVFLSIPISEACKLQFSNISVPNDFIAQKKGAISIDYQNVGKIAIGNLKFTISGNIDGEKLEYSMDSLGVGIENKIDCYLKFLEEGIQDVNIKATYLDDEGKEYILDEGTISITVAKNSENSSITTALKNDSIRNNQYVQQGSIIGCSFLAIMFVVIWKNKKTKLKEKEAR